MTAARWVRASLLLAWAGAVGAAQPREPATPAIPDWAKSPAYMQPATDPAAVTRGQSLFVTNGCSFCHGADARGGNGGPNLVRAHSVLNDRRGELIATPIGKGVSGTAMRAFAFSEAEIIDLAQFLHSLPVSGNDRHQLKPAVFTSGDAKAGQKYFARRCGNCHAADGDLKGIATRITDPRELQQRWLMPRTATPTLATVTQSDGSLLKGRLLRIDEFLITLGLADGSLRSIERTGEVPRVELNDPRAAHKGLLPGYRDHDIHDVTAYLATLK